MTQPQWLAQQAQPNVTGPSLAIGGADAPATGGDCPTISHMMMTPNRLVAIIPMKIERNVKAPGEAGNTQDRITADVLIIDGGPITYGGKPWSRPPVPDTFRIEALPYLCTNVWISNRVLVTQLERKVGNGIVVGRLYYGEAKNGNNAPYKISEDPTPAELDFVRQWWASYSAGQWQNPPAIPLATAMMPQMFGPPPATLFGQPAGGLGGAVYQPDSWAQQQAPAGAAVGQLATPPTPAGFAAPAAPTMPAFITSPAAAPPAAAEPDWTLDVMPPGFMPEHKQQWQTQATKEQRLQMLAQHGINGPGQQPTGL